jgi:hypothetical protein
MNGRYHAGQGRGSVNYFTAWGLRPHILALKAEVTSLNNDKNSICELFSTNFYRLDIFRIVTH